MADKGSKVVQSDWNTPNSQTPDPQEALRGTDEHGDTVYSITSAESPR
jgi:hypothetical protein